MKILAFTDPHGNKNVLEKHRKDVAEKGVDLVIITGDLTFFGRDTALLLEKVNDLGAPVLLLHGNHDDEQEFKKHVSKFPNITLMHKQFKKIDEWWFGAYATSGLRDAYPDQEAWAVEHAAELKTKKPLVWLDHPPPRDTNLDRLAEDWHVGSESLRKFIEKYTPSYVFCGHIHESFGMETMIGDTVIINAGPTGKIFEL